MTTKRLQAGRALDLRLDIEFYQHKLAAAIGRRDEARHEITLVRRKLRAMETERARILADANVCGAIRTPMPHGYSKYRTCERPVGHAGVHADHETEWKNQ